MFFDYPQNYNYGHDDFYRALAAQRARERREAEYHARLQEARQRQQLEEALRRNAYQSYLARERRRSHPYFSGFDSDDEYPSTPSCGYSRSPYESRQRPRDQDFFDSLRQEPRRPTHYHKRTPSPVSAQEFPGYLASSTLSQRSRSPPSSKPKPVYVGSPQRDVREQAAGKIQAFFRTYMPRYRSIKAISSIAREFETVIQNFTFPESFDFAERFDAMELLYTSKNAPIHSHEHTLLKLLSKLDSIDSHGDGHVRAARKNLVNEIERELEKLDSRKLAAWEAYKATSLVASNPVEDKGELSCSMAESSSDSKGTEMEMEITEDKINDTGYLSSLPLEPATSADVEQSPVVDSDQVNQDLTQAEGSATVSPNLLRLTNLDVSDSQCSDSGSTWEVTPCVEPSAGMDVEQSQSFGNVTETNTNTLKGRLEDSSMTLDKAPSLSAMPIELYV